MPRGSNYINNNKGVTLQVSRKKKHAVKMIACSYGAACTRADCIYSHPNGKGAESAYHHQSKEPCMSFLADMCAFTAKTCRKRHPPRAEAERLIAKYRRMPCRFRDECRTAGCLYLHPGDEAYNCYFESECIFVNPELQQQQQQQSEPVGWVSTYSNNMDATNGVSVNAKEFIPASQYGMGQQLDEVQYESTYNAQQQEINAPYTTSTEGININAREFVPGSLQGFQQQAQEKQNQHEGSSWAPTLTSLESMEGTNVNAKEFVPKSSNPSTSTGTLGTSPNTEGTNVNAREFVPGNWM